MTIAIFDIDGCVSDDSHRRKHLPKDGKCDKDYERYYDGCMLDKPINMSMVSFRHAWGSDIVFVTARPASMRKQTMEWLTTHLPKEVRGDFTLHMRPEGNRQPSRELKPEIVLTHYSAHDVSRAYDDRPEVVRAYQENNIPAEVLDLALHHVSQLKVKPTPSWEDNAVPTILRQCAATFEERAKTYGPSYLQFGPLCSALFPNGIQLETEEDFIKFGIFTQCASKLLRYAGSEMTHVDSAHDLSVYAAMLEAVTDDR